MITHILSQYCDLHISSFNLGVAWFFFLRWMSSCFTGPTWLIVLGSVVMDSISLSLNVNLGLDFSPNLIWAMIP